MNKLKSYINDLLKNKVQLDKDIYSDKNETIEKKENLKIFINFVNEIYKNEKISVFTFPFLENIDDFIIKPENIYLIKQMFKIIQKQAFYFDIITSGDFGKWIYKLIEDKVIKFNNNLVVVNGQIRKVKEDENNKIEILKKRFNDISYKDFIFIDDSFVSGGTRDKIDEFLRKKFNSRIIKTFAFYTHYHEDEDDVHSEYCYADENKEKIIPIHKHMDFINSIDLKSYEDIIYSNIKNGQISEMRDLFRIIKRISEAEKFALEKKKHNF